MDEFIMNFKEDKLVIKYSKRSLIVMELIFGIVPIFAFTTIIFRDKFIFHNMLMPIIFIVIQIIIFIWFKSFLIEIDNGILKYHTFFGGTKWIRLTDIKRAFIESGYSPKKYAFIRLEIIAKPGSQIKDFYVNLKVFEPKGVKELLKILSIKK